MRQLTYRSQSRSVSVSQLGPRCHWNNYRKNQWTEWKFKKWLSVTSSTLSLLYYHLFHWRESMFGHLLIQISHYSEIGQNERKWLLSGFQVPGLLPDADQPRHGVQLLPLHWPLLRLLLGHLDLVWSGHMLPENMWFVGFKTSCSGKNVGCDVCTQTDGRKCEDRARIL